MRSRYVAFAGQLLDQLLTQSLCNRQGLVFTLACLEAAVIAAMTFLPSQSASLPLPRLHPSASVDPERLQPSSIFLVGILAVWIGSSIRATCYRYLGRFFTFQLSLQTDHKLVKDGPYAIVRHPSYVGACFLYAGVCLFQLAPCSLLSASGLWESTLGKVLGAVYVAHCVFVSCWLLARVPKEDAVLRKEFEDEWNLWAKQTPYKLVPYVY